jgi:hypothetical protein
MCYHLHISIFKNGIKVKVFRAANVVSMAIIVIACNVGLALNPGVLFQLF